MCTRGSHDDNYKDLQLHRAGHLTTFVHSSDVFAKPIHDKKLVKCFVFVQKNLKIKIVNCIGIRIAVAHVYTYLI